MSTEPIPNHSIDPNTGFLESNAYIQAFDAKKKQVFLQLFRENGLKFWRTCAELGVKGDTVHHHYNIDPAFKQALDQVKTEYFDELEGVSRTNALNPRSVIERIFQLKARFPEKYGDGKRESGMQITLNIDGKLLEMVKKRDEVIEAQIITSTHDLARESTTLSDSNTDLSNNTRPSVE